MAQLFLADVHNGSEKSTETIYEIKAPLATFDTVDLDDDQISLRSVQTDNVSELPEKGIREAAEIESKGSSFDSNEGRDLSTPTPVSGSQTGSTSAHVSHEVDTNTVVKLTDKHKALDNDSSNTVQSDTEITSCATTQTNDDMMDPNSSENNASAEEIQKKLKVKGRKHKEKASNVKYEKIDNSDVSDYERSSPMPGMKLGADNMKGFSTDSDTSDSDDGYIRGGFIATAKGGKSSKHGKSSWHYAQNRLGIDSVDSDSTPCSSPKVTRPALPPPLSKEDAEKKSKKKAYEKRLQRLQVTTSPIERPRSTTPINIHSLEDYASISSPEKSSTPSSLEKLKITLPLEETYKSPKRTPRSGEANDVFNFSEDLLFTHTKSAILVEDGGERSASPKRILVPPTLSPKLSPARSPIISRSGSSSPRYYFSPGTKWQGHSRSSSHEITPDFFTVTHERWANFDSVSNKNEEPKDKYEGGNGLEGTDKKADLDHLRKNLFADASTIGDGDTRNNEVHGFGDDFSNIVSVSDKEKELNTEEILTVKIETQGDTHTCDIKFDVVEKNLKEDQSNNKTNEDQSNSKTVNIETVDTNRELEKNTENGIAEDKSLGGNKTSLNENVVESVC